MYEAAQWESTGKNKDLKMCVTRHLSKYVCHLALSMQLQHLVVPGCSYISVETGLHSDIMSSVQIFVPPFQA